jgi:hypothetical protein
MLNKCYQLQNKSSRKLKLQIRQMNF